MQPIPHHEPFEVEFGRVLTELLLILQRDMDESSMYLLHRAGTDSQCIHYRAAEIATRIVGLCRRLLKQIHRYEQTRWWQHPQQPADPDPSF